MYKLKPLKQKDFNLVIIEDLGVINEKRYTIFKCPKCNKPYKSETSAVKTGRSKKCFECHKKSLIENQTTHGKATSKLYRVWTSMKSRCYNKNHQAYINYGVRDITVCDEWKNSFEDFEKWALNSGYSEGLSIDRINNDGNYEPLNCRWATRITQARNTRKLKISNTSGYRGVRMTKNGKRWKSSITVNSKKIHIGTFDTAKEASNAYDNYVIENKLEHTKNGEIK